MEDTYNFLPKQDFAEHHLQLKIIEESSESSQGSSVFVDGDHAASKNYDEESCNSYEDKKLK